MKRNECVCGYVDAPCVCGPAMPEVAEHNKRELETAEPFSLLIPDEDEDMEGMGWCEMIEHMRRHGWRLCAIHQDHYIFQK